MLLLTRLNGPVFALNPDLIERADATPDTVITLINGTRYVVAETLAELAALVRDYRAETASAAYHAPSTAAASYGERRAGANPAGQVPAQTHAEKQQSSHAATRGTVVELWPGDQ